MMYRLVEAQAEQLAEQGDSTFQGWYEEDLHKFTTVLDADDNGVLDKKEFTAWVTNQFDLSEKDIDEVFKKWDLDKGGTVGPYEYCTLMAVWHTEQDLLLIKKAVKAAEHTVEAMMPPCACGSLSCYINSAMLSIGCCLCTACTSLCAFYCCCTRPLAERIQYMEEHQQELEKKAQQDFTNMVLQSVKKILLKGPSDELKLITKELEAPGKLEMQSAPITSM